MRYHCYLTQTTCTDMVVEADSPDAAREKAKDEFNKHEWTCDIEVRVRQTNEPVRLPCD